jgi:hypothetical protein
VWPFAFLAYYFGLITMWRARHPVFLKFSVGTAAYGTLIGSDSWMAMPFQDRADFGALFIRPAVPLKEDALMTATRLLSESRPFQLADNVYLLQAFQVADGVFESQLECQRCAQTTEVEGSSVTSDLALAGARIAAEYHHSIHHGVLGQAKNC